MHEASAEQASRTVIAFLEAVAAGDVDTAFSAHVADDFHHHNPWFADDRAAMCEAMKASAAAEPGKCFEVQKGTRTNRSTGAARSQPDHPRPAGGQRNRAWRR